MFCQRGLSVKHFRIGICDDERETCAELEKAVDSFFARSRYNYDVYTWPDGSSLCKELTDGNQLDILFLDIELPDINGVDIGKKIRERFIGTKPAIVYISSKTGYALELFQVHPYDFLIKPVRAESVEKVLKQILFLDELDEAIFTFAYRRTEKSILLGRIMFFASNDKKIEVHMSDGTVETYTARLGDEKQKLPESFATVSKSFVINLKYIASCNAETVTLQDGHSFNITPPNRETFRKAYIDYRKSR